MKYFEKDLVLDVSKNVDPEKWDEGFYQRFLDILFEKRTYQKYATETALRYLNSGEYNSLSDLARENFQKNEVLQEKYNGNFETFRKQLELPDKLAATLDLATGTGKSYVMIALSLIMLASRKVDRVLILVPSITIETELTEKFVNALMDDQLLKSLGDDFKVPEILNGDSTLTMNSITIENRNAIYDSQTNRNSIVASLQKNGERTLVLNDEAHHVYYSEENKWKEFILDKKKNDINFRYIIGLTGTPYRKVGTNSDSNEYFNDVIFRYSLREAIEQNYVKDIEYISKEDMPNNRQEKWQIIYKSHLNIKEEINRKIDILPITIIVTSTQKRADTLAKEFRSFLKESYGMSNDTVNESVISVHSGTSAAKDRILLKDVDNPMSKVEFIFSVSMLTEGWDVKRVFQIVPDEERAFNSKLLISQVLGRGLRKPEQWSYSLGNPTVVVFNHEKWASKVSNLVDEILEIRKTITCKTDKSSKFNFELKNIEYVASADVTEIIKNDPYNLWIKTNDKYQPILNEQGKQEIIPVKIPTEISNPSVKIELKKIRDQGVRSVELGYLRETITVDEMAEIMYYRFDDLEDEKLTNHYREFWTIDKIKEMIKLSLAESGNLEITRAIKNAFLSSMNILFRSNSRSVVYDRKPSMVFTLNTQNLKSETSDLNNFKRNKTLFFTSEFEKSIEDDMSKLSLREIKDTSKGYKHIIIENKYNFKTPQNAIITTGIPETDFLKQLIKEDVSKSIDCFVKSADIGFYDIEYVWKKGSHHKTAKFNPDWFIKKGNLIIMVETKDDSQIADPDAENVGKYRASIEHFKELNNELSNEGIDISYKPCFITPIDYDNFFKVLVSGDIKKFNSKLDVSLSGYGKVQSK